MEHPTTEYLTSYTSGRAPDRSLQPRFSLVRALGLAARHDTAQLLGCTGAPSDLLNDLIHLPRGLPIARSCDPSVVFPFTQRDLQPAALAVRFASGILDRGIALTLLKTEPVYERSASIFFHRSTGRCGYGTTQARGLLLRVDAEGRVVRFQLWPAFILSSSFWFSYMGAAGIHFPMHTTIAAARDAMLSVRDLLDELALTPHPLQTPNSLRSAGSNHTSYQP